MKKALALILAVLMLLSVIVGCGTTSSDNNGGSSTAQGTTTGGDSDGSGTTATPTVSEENQLKELTTTGTVGRDLSTLCILNATGPSTFRTTTNFFDPLVTVDSLGNYLPCLAESWEYSDDGLTWTFHIRQGATWSDSQGNVKADVVASDWVYGLEWTLNAAKGQSAHATTANDYIVGAKDYYDYTCGLEESEAYALGTDKFLEMVGIETPDDYTVVYHLIERCPYFLSLTTTFTFYPISGAFIDEIGAKNVVSCSYDKMWYSGPYVLQNWVEDNSKTIVPNPNWWDTESTRFEKWTVLMVESSDVSYQMYLNGEVDETEVTTSYAQLINADPSNENYGKIVQGVPSGVSWYVAFNFAKKNDDGTWDDNWNKAIANEAFRQCFYYGVNLTNYLSSTNPFDPLSLNISTFTAYNVSKLSDGTDYTDLVLNEIGVARDNDTYPHMDADKTAALKAQAMEELSAQGVTFPIEVVVYSGSAQSSIDQTTLFKEDVEDGLGTDFVTVTIKTYVSSYRQEVIGPQAFSVALDGNAAEFMDPTTYLMQFRSDMDEDLSMIMDIYGNIKRATDSDLLALLDEYNQMYKDADAIVDSDARLEALSKVEAFAIEHALFIPTRANRALWLTKINKYTQPTNANDFQNNRYVNIETNKDGYTEEEYKAFYEAFISGFVQG